MSDWPHTIEFTVEGVTDMKRRIRLAKQVVDDLCSGKRRWTMSIPARPDYDPDLLIYDALVIAKAAVEEAERLRFENNELKRPSISIVMGPPRSQTVYEQKPADDWWSR